MATWTKRNGKKLPGEKREKDDDGVKLKESFAEETVSSKEKNSGEMLTHEQELNLISKVNGSVQVFSNMEETLGKLYTLYKDGNYRVTKEILKMLASLAKIGDLLD